ncbi:MAG: ankyrin repeat domain-containing protein [Psychroflexus halocasei]
MRISILTLILLTSLIGFAQKNPFTERDYWTKNPSIKSIKADMAKGHDISTLSSNSFDATTWAILNDVDLETILFLLEQKGNGVNKLTHDGRTYLFWAAYKGNIKLMDHLLKNGAKTDLVDDHGNIVQTFAAGAGQKDPKLYAFMQKNNLPIKATNRNGANVLLLLMSHLEKVNEIDFLIKAGLDLKSTDHDGNNAFMYAVRKGNISLLKELIQEGINPKVVNEKGENAIFMASYGARGYSNPIEVYQFLTELGLESNITNTDNATPLHKISRNTKDTKIFDFFINKDVDVNQQNTKGQTALMNAAAYNDLSVLEYLIKKGAKVEKTNNNKQTALMLATQINSAKVVDFLIKNNAKTEVKDKKGNTLVYYLIQAEASKDFEEKYKLLVDKINFKGLQANRNNLYHLAVEKKSEKLLALAKKHQADINQVNQNGLTPLHLASMTAQNPEFIKAVLKHGAKLNIKTDFDESAYDLASQNELLKGDDISFLKS